MTSARLPSKFRAAIQVAVHARDAGFEAPLAAWRWRFGLSDDREGFRCHELKTLRPFFRDVAKELKTFELRKNDRGFEVGDALLLREWTGKRYTGKHERRLVAYVLRSDDLSVLGGRSPLRASYVILSIV